MKTGPIEILRAEYQKWRTDGRRRDGFFRLVCRGFDLVAGTWTPPSKASAGRPPRDFHFLESDFSIRSFRAAVKRVDRLEELVATTGVFGAATPLRGTDEDEVWTYYLALVGEKVLAWLAGAQPARAELLFALAGMKEALHRGDEAAELRDEARALWARNVGKPRVAALAV